MGKGKRRREKSKWSKAKKIDYLILVNNEYSIFELINTFFFFSGNMLTQEDMAASQVPFSQDIVHEMEHLMLSQGP